MPRTLLALACLLLMSACAATRSASDSQSAQRSSSGADIVRDAARALREMRAQTPSRILDYALEDACAVIVLPGIYQAGFFYSVHGGGGVLVARRAGGAWGAPAFVGVGGAGFGVQIGLEKQRLVLVVQEPEMLERILQGGLHFDSQAKYDVLGVREQTGPDSLTERRPVAVFTDGVGLMAGVALRGAVLSLNSGLTAAYHGQDGRDGQGDARAVLQSASAPGLEVFELWTALAVDLPQGQIQRTRAGAN